MNEHANDQVLTENPFLLMMNPEIVIAAMEKSERLAALNRHTCRPLDRVLPTATSEESDAAAAVAERGQ